MPANTKQLMSNKEYCTQGGTHCPYCGSDDIEGSSIQIDGTTAWQPITCLSCEMWWHDIYTLTAYEPVD